VKRLSPTRGFVGVLSFMAVLMLSGCVSAVGGSGPDASLDRGMQFLQARDYKAAKSELGKAKALQSGNARALTALAIAADMTGDFRLADKAYEQLLLRATDRAGLFNNMGYSFMLRGDLDKALQYLTESDRLQPGNPTVRNNLQMLRSVTVR
jgi:Flp pilus assembly protein TadD